MRACNHLHCTSELRGIDVKPAARRSDFTELAATNAGGGARRQRPRHALLWRFSLTCALATATQTGSARSVGPPELARWLQMRRALSITLVCRSRAK